MRTSTGVTQCANTMHNHAQLLDTWYLMSYEERIGFWPICIDRLKKKIFVDQLYAEEAVSRIEKKNGKGDAPFSSLHSFEKFCKLIEAPTKLQKQHHLTVRFCVHVQLQCF